MSSSLSIRIYYDKYRFLPTDIIQFYKKRESIEKYIKKRKSGFDVAIHLKLWKIAVKFKYSISRYATFKLYSRSLFIG